MKFIQGQSREQTYLFPVSLDDSIGADNVVRIIDAFVDSLDLKTFGFKVDFGENGRPGYRPGSLLKLYIYSYMNKIRSSRDIERECYRNIEVMWLMGNLQPDHNTISNFRKDNPCAIKKAFRATVNLAKNFNLIGGVLLAGDSTKLRAQNSKKNNYNLKKVARHIEYIDNKLADYTAILAESDGDESEQKRVKTEIEKQNKRKSGYLQIKSELEESGETQISTSDPDSRHLITRNNITEVGYNIQTTVDAENNIPIDYKVTNVNDSKAMGNMLQRAKTILRSSNFTVLYDKGYHTGSEFSVADSLGIKTLVAIPMVAAQAPNPMYNVEHFIYSEENDWYQCPEGQLLTTTGTLHKAKQTYFKRYTTKACMSCRVKSQCSKAAFGKGVQRSQYQKLIEENKERIEHNAHYYKKRQAIVEHPYGTIKRQWGFNYIMTKKSMKRASADLGLIMIAYNMKRIINILGKESLRKYLKGVTSFFRFKKAIQTYISDILSIFYRGIISFSYF